MKKFWMVAVVVAAVMMVAGPALARQGGRRPRPQGGMRRGVLAQVEKLTDLTEEQKAKIAELRKALPEKFKAADTREKRMELMRTLTEDVKKVLTEEQVKKLDELIKAASPVGRTLALLEKLELTDPQKEKVAELAKSIDEKLKAAGDDFQKQREVYRSLSTEIKKILTDEQAKKFDELRRAMWTRPTARKKAETKAEKKVE